MGGIVGLALVEHFILLSKPKKSLAMLIGSVLTLFAFGTLPQVNNFSLIVGLLYGCMFAMLFWSCIMFQRRVALIQSLLIFVIVTLFLFSLVLFYGVQQIRADSFFSFINCIPYVKGLCDYV